MVSTQHGRSQKVLTSPRRHQNAPHNTTAKKQPITGTPARDPELERDISRYENDGGATWGGRAAGSTASPKPPARLPELDRAISRFEDEGGATFRRS